MAKAKIKIPKQVGGFEIPKKVRKRAKQTLKMAESPAMKAFAAAAAATAAKAGREARQAGDEARTEARRFAANVTVDAERLGEAFRTAAIDGLRRFLEGFEEGLRNIADAAEDAATQARDVTPKRGRKSSGPGPAES